MRQDGARAQSLYDDAGGHNGRRWSLARMTHQAAIALGQCLRVLAADEADPAAQVSADVVLGSHDSLDDLRRAAAGAAAALTLTTRAYRWRTWKALEADGVAVLPPSAALHYAQDKLAMRRRLSELGLPVPDFADLSGSVQSPVTRWSSSGSGTAGTSSSRRSEAAMTDAACGCSTIRPGHWRSLTRRRCRPN